MGFDLLTPLHYRACDLCRFGEGPPGTRSCSHPNATKGPKLTCCISKAGGSMRRQIALFERLRALITSRLWASAATLKATLDRAEKAEGPIVCFGVCCPHHSACKRYRDVDGAADQPRIDSCQAGDQWPLLKKN